MNNKISLTLDDAKIIAAASEVEARRNNWPVVIAIVDDGGHLVQLLRLDDAQFGSVEVAIQKARAAIAFRRPTKVFADQFAAGNTGFMSFPHDARPIASEGGMPIIVNGRLIGASGMSGGTGQQDGVASAAGANVMM